MTICIELSLHDLSRLMVLANEKAEHWKGAVNRASSSEAKEIFRDLTNQYENLAAHIRREASSGMSKKNMAQKSDTAAERFPACVTPYDVSSPNFPLGSKGQAGFSRDEQ